MCFHDPPSRAIKAVFDAFPAAINRFTASGLPLDIVLSDCHDHYNNSVQNYQTAEVPRLILRFDMEWQEQNGPGQNPLGASTHKSYPQDIVSLLLHDYPALAVRRDPEHNYVENDDQEFTDSPLEKMCMFYSFAQGENHGHRRNLDKLYALLRAYDRAPTGSTQPLTEILPDHRPLHTFLSYIVNMHNLYGGEVEADNSFGFLPIIEAMLENDPTQFGRETVKIIQLLVKMHPRAASTSNREGMLPLHLALEIGWPFKPIMEAAMQVISTRDVLTRMYPFQLAGLSFLGDDYVNEIHPNLPPVDASYLLLRQNPMLVCSGINALDIGATRKRSRKKSKTRR